MLLYLNILLVNNVSIKITLDVILINDKYLEMSVMSSSIKQISVLILGSLLAGNVWSFDIGGLVKQVTGVQIPPTVSPQPIKTQTVTTQEVNPFQKDKQDADKFAEKLFYSSSEFCARIADNPSVKAYASVFEKLHTDAAKLAVDERGHYQSVKSQFLDSNDLLKNWIAAQVKTEGVPYYAEHILSAKVIQMANECANQHINDTLYYFFDPAGTKRNAGNQSSSDEKEVLDANGNLVKAAPQEQPTKVLLANYSRVDERFLKGQQISVARTTDSQVVSFWALALRNSDAAIKNSSQDRLESEQAKVEQWLIDEQARLVRIEEEKQQQSQQLKQTQLGVKLYNYSEQGFSGSMKIAYRSDSSVHVKIMTSSNERYGTCDQESDAIIKDGAITFAGMGDGKVSILIQEDKAVVDGLDGDRDDQVCGSGGYYSGNYVLSKEGSKSAVAVQVATKELEPITMKERTLLGGASYGCSSVKVLTMSTFELGNEPYFVDAKKAAVKINGKLVILKAEDKARTKFSNSESKVKVWRESVENGKYEHLHLKVGDAIESEPMNVYELCAGGD
jgi:hypothetical protein